MYYRTTCLRVQEVSPLRQQKRAQCKTERQGLLFKRREKPFLLCSTISLSPHDLEVFLRYLVLHPLPLGTGTLLGKCRPAQVFSHTWSPPTTQLLGYLTVTSPSSCPRPGAGTADGQPRTHPGIQRGGQRQDRAPRLRPQHTIQQSALKTQIQRRNH